MEKLANHIALQSIAGGMEKQGFYLADLVGAGAGTAAAALGSKDHKTLSGILGTGTGLIGGKLAEPLIDVSKYKLLDLAEKVKNPKLKAVLLGLAPVTDVVGKSSVAAGAGYGTGKFVDWLADKIG